MLLIAALVATAAFAGAGAAFADIANCGNPGTCENVQEGDNDADSEQSGASSSGDAVGGQVTGIVSSGDASVDATNRSEDVDIETGEAHADNSQAFFVGLNVSGSVSITADLTNITANNVQEGDNSLDTTQTANASSGDGVGGSVIGVVTAAGGSADVVAANTSEDVDIETGEATAENDGAYFVGLNNATSTVNIAADIDTIQNAVNVQEGDNDLSADQAADAASGDGVGGQVIGVVSAGDASVDATNLSEDVDIVSGDSEALNDAAAFVGLNQSNTVTITADITNITASNVQEGDNDKSVSQTADASSGDAVAGQVAGVVTSAGGSAEAVLANTSEDTSVESGESTFFNDETSFIGLNWVTAGLVI